MSMARKIPLFSQVVVSRLGMSQAEVVFGE
jgi:hypothetical protein